MKKIIVSLLALAMCVNICSVAGAKGNESVYIYVDSQAEAGGDGSFENPFQTLEDAQEGVRKIKAQGYPDGGITVSVRGGTYKILKSLSFGENDSGTKEAPVVWRAYGNEQVNLIGGAEVKFSDFKKVSDEEILKRIEDEAKNNIYELDLDKMGIDVFDEFGIYGQAAYEMTNSGKNPTNGLSLPAIYWDGQSTEIARYPNNGEYLAIEKAIAMGSDTDYTQQMSFTVGGTRMSKWENADDAWLWGMLYYDWADVHMPIDSFVASENKITTKYSCTYGVKAGQRLYVYNILEEIDSPGEWYVDKDAKKLYIYPPTKDNDANIILAFGSNPILKFNNADYITFRDMSIKGTRSNAVDITKCRGIGIKYCEIAYASATGVMVQGRPTSEGLVGKSSYEIEVEGCHIHTVGSQGVYMHFVGNIGDLTPGDSKVKNCWIHDFGMLSKTYAGAVNTRGVGVEISHNLIHDCPHLALNPQGNDIVVKYNDISNALKETADSGIIYFGGNTVQRGTVIESNYIHDSDTNSNSDWSIHAIYIDDAGAGATIRKNIISNIGGNGVFINGGRDNTVENNIFANLKSYGSKLSASFLSGDWYANWETNKLGTSIFQSKVDFSTEPYSKYPHLQNIVEDDPPFPKYNTMQNNISYNCKAGQFIEPLQSGYSAKEIASWGTMGDEIVTNSDIGFVDVEANEFQLKDDSEAYETLPEFEKLEYDRMGLITSRLKQALSDDAVAMVVGEPRTYVNWTRTMIDEDNYSVVPFIKDNLTYVPVRYLFEAFGASVAWNDGKAEIKYQDKTIILEQNSDRAWVDGKEVIMNAGVINTGGRIFVPLRSCSELMEKNVLWNDKGLVIVSREKLEDAFAYDEMVDDLIARLSER